jgi:uncharacterized membrane protein YdjX (TVP38/TMEM64 family)
VEGPAQKGLPWARIALGVLALAALIALGRAAGGYVPQFAQWVEDLGVWGPVVFVAGYAVATVAFIPGSLLTLAAGAIFGVVEGVVLVWVGAVIGSTAAFLVARYVARDAFERRIAQEPRFATIDRAVGEQGLKIAFLLRLSPAFPFNLLNYALGVTRVRLLDYLIAALGMLPATLLYVYSGKVAGDVAAAAGGVPMERGAGYYAWLVLGLIATAVVTIFVTRIARRALAEATGEGA